MAHSYWWITVRPLTLWHSYVTYWKHRVRVNHSVWFARKSKAHSSVLVVSKTESLQIFSGCPVLRLQKTNKQIESLFTKKNKKKNIQTFFKPIWQCKHEKRANFLVLPFSFSVKMTEIEFWHWQCALPFLAGDSLREVNSNLNELCIDLIVWKK